MSTHTPSNERTESKTTAPDTHRLAAELGVDAALLARFVSDHPNPTAPIVLGWSVNHGELRIHPEQLRPDVEAWLADRTGRAAPEPLDVPDDGRLRWNRDDLGGEE